MENNDYAKTLNKLKTIRKYSLWAFYIIFIIIGVIGNIQLWGRVRDIANNAGVTFRFTDYAVEYLTFIAALAFILLILFTLYTLIFLRPFTRNKFLYCSLYALIASFCIMGSATFIASSLNQSLTLSIIGGIPGILLIIFIVTKLIDSFLRTMMNTKSSN